MVVKICGVQSVFNFDCVIETAFYLFIFLPNAACVSLITNKVLVVFSSVVYLVGCYSQYHSLIFQSDFFRQSSSYQSIYYVLPYEEFICYLFVILLWFSCRTYQIHFFKCYVFCTASVLLVKEAHVVFSHLDSCTLLCQAPSLLFQQLQLSIKEKQTGKKNDDRRLLLRLKSLSGGY